MKSPNHTIGRLLFNYIFIKVDLSGKISNRFLEDVKLLHRIQGILWPEDDGKSHLFEEDLLNQYKGKSIEEILREHPNTKQGKINRQNPYKRNGLCPVYYDTMMSLCIKRLHKSYDKFFAYLLKHTDLMKLDLCLDYQLENHHENKLTNFSRFLHLVIRKYKGEILSESTSITIQEWISLKEKQSVNESITKDELFRKRNGFLRQGDDKLTSLNREQTVLLIYYLQTVKVFLRDEYLTDTDAGRAFELLTGYSSNTIRQGLTNFMNYQNNHNLIELKRVLQQLIYKVESDIASLHWGTVQGDSKTLHYPFVSYMNPNETGDREIFASMYFVFILIPHEIKSQSNSRTERFIGVHWTLILLDRYW